MEQYFKANEKVLIISMYLSGATKLWWRMRTSDETCPVIETRGHTEEGTEGSIPALQFIRGARESLRGLRHTSSVIDYVKEFNSLLNIRDMLKEDKLFNFMVGFQNWAQLELCHLGVKDLCSAIAATDDLFDYMLGNLSTSKFEENKSGEKNGKYNASKFKPKADDSQSKTGQTNKDCFLHRVKDCPKCEALNAIVDDQITPKSNQRPVSANLRS